MKLLVHTLLPLLVGAHTAFAHGWTVDSLPDPRISALACGRWPWQKGQVCSPDRLLNQADIDKMDFTISLIHEGQHPFSKLPCAERGVDVPVEIVAVVIDEVDGSGDAAVKVAGFADGIRERFSVGGDACGNGAVVVMSVNDNQVRLVVSLRIIKSYRHARSRLHGGVQHTYVMPA